MRMAGVEPAWAGARKILSLLCIPFHHIRQLVDLGPNLSSEQHIDGEPLDTFYAQDYRS